MRTIDPFPFNRIAEDPEVRPFLGFRDPTKPIDLTPMVANVNNYCFLTPCRGGGYIVERRAPGLYAAHTLAIKSARGRPMLTLMRMGFRYLFTGTDAVEVATMIPDGAEAAEKWSNVAGFKPIFRREKHFPFFGEMVGTTVKSLRYDDWVLGDPENMKAGLMFHNGLRAMGHAPQHEDDPHHDFWVGATIWGCVNGTAMKAISLYNRYAVVAGYGQATLISTAPLLINTGDALVTATGGNLEILKILG